MEEVQRHGLMEKDDDSVVYYKPQMEIDENYPQLDANDFVLVIMNEAQGY